MRAPKPPDRSYLTTNRLEAFSDGVIAKQGPGSPLAAAVGKDWKGKLSMVAYLAAIPLAFVAPWISHSLYAAVAVVWLVPDRRIERVLSHGQS
jgi:uncharacterized membrane protein